MMFWGTYLEGRYQILKLKKKKTTLLPKRFAQAVSGTYHMAIYDQSYGAKTMADTFASAC